MFTPFEEFARTLDAQATRYGVQLTAPAITVLRQYYEIVDAWNARLHLIAPCSPAEFATRHVLESLMAVRHFRVGSQVTDIGSGAGLPIIPCLIARPDISATLIEASQKKSVFLREALRATGTQERAQVCAERFEKMSAPGADFITCRALERFTALFSKIVAWSPPSSTLLLFGGPTLRAEIEKARLKYAARQMPESEQRFLFIIERQSEEPFL